MAPLCASFSHILRRKGTSLRLILSHSQEKGHLSAPHIHLIYTREAIPRVVYSTYTPGRLYPGWYGRVYTHQGGYTQGGRVGYTREAIPRVVGCTSGCTTPYMPPCTSWVYTRLCLPVHPVPPWVYRRTTLYPGVPVPPYPVSTLPAEEALGSKRRKPVGRAASQPLRTLDVWRLVCLSAQSCSVFPEKNG